MRDDLAVWCRVARAQSDKQRAVEPATILVTAFEVHVVGPLQFRVVAQHRFVTRARVEPDVQDVAFALKIGAVALCAPQASGQKFGQVALVPGVRAMVREDGGRAVGQRGVQHRLATPGAVDSGNRYPPRSLSRDAPVRTVR